MPGTANDLNISESGYVTFDGTSVFHGRTFQAGTGITITNPNGVSGNTTISSTASLTDLHLPRFIVASSTNATGANFTSIASAIAAAQGTGVNSTIALQPGTYTENFTLHPGINLVALQGDQTTPNVTIVGKITMTETGTASISNIRLQTNSDFFIVVSGSSASQLQLNNCFLNCSNNTGISFTNSSGSSKISINNCTGDLGTTGIKLFDCSGSFAGTLNIIGSNFSNTGSSATASTIVGGSLGLYFNTFQSAISSSGTAGTGIYHNLFQTSGIAVTTLTIGGSGTNMIEHCNFISGSSSSISIGSTAGVDLCNVSSSNTNAITGAGTLNLGVITFTGSSSTINTSTVTSLTSEIGSLNLNTALTVPNGGTGRTTLTNHGVLVGAGTTAITQLSVGASNSVLQGSTGADPSFTTTPQLVGLGIGAASTGSGLTFDGSSTLSTYSVGTFSPTVQGSSTAGTVSMEASTGRYQKIGRIATVSISCSWTTIGTATGSPQLTNLPFTVVNNSGGALCPTLATGGNGRQITTASGAVPFIQPNANATTCNLNYYLGATPSNNAGVITATNGFACQLVYETT